MNLEDLKNAKATYDLYGATMLNPDVMNFLFDFAISAKEPGVKAEATEGMTFGEANDIAPAKPKRTAKKAD